MDNKEFSERLWANPRDTSAELLEAISAHPERALELEQAQALDSLLQRTLNGVSAPVGLRQKLLQPELLENRPGVLATSSLRAANDSLSLRRILPVAACMVIALGLAWYGNYRQEAALEKEVFGHLYREAAFLDNTALVSMGQVNAKLDTAMGAQLNTGQEVSNLQVTYADDCWIAKHASFHMIMKGRMGAVSVMMIPNSPVSAEFNISDDHYKGVVSPTSRGNLVVIGDDQQEIEQYRTLLTNNLKWEY